MLFFQKFKRIENYKIMKYKEKKNREIEKKKERKMEWRGKKHMSI